MKDYFSWGELGRTIQEESYVFIVREMIELTQLWMKGHL